MSLAFIVAFYGSQAAFDKLVADPKATAEDLMLSSAAILRVIRRRPEHIVLDASNTIRLAVLNLRELTAAVEV